ncbi:MAG: 3-mercaptopyruvate sulfurtransferase [Alphaproteobacteria bacterium]|nr:3-mercaptopyruvate sulfurtransferase [Alphaproteobacteria bacterium]MBU1281715.1 3-mercaptopyruvate sulfurtransferase [Alphaproteobacteria bacterium]MBU1573398.1 3-mercaptopyruvate sulfurtransferase [Alphaproteobacteria bacterium]MBU1830624.1 3-mercaptopyruvate sulfurtransferase [Alphaproteobacteria bacterium]MBU2077792.1 3-mercaptopyruvate sulfurtransferase [Alphaproteobacteria bacterium]
MPYSDPKTLVSTKWLSEHLKSPELRLIDASWYMPADNRDCRAEYEAEHIPGARFVDVDEVADLRSDLPHMLPPVEKFMSRMRELGIGDGHQVVVYDTAGVFSAPRVWWMFKYFGQDNVAVLDGGLPRWKAEGHPVTAEPPTIRDRHMITEIRPELLRDVTQVAASSKLGDYTIIDARSAARFKGEASEPRPGLRSGHIPNSRNVPFQELLTPQGTLKSTDNLRAVFVGAGVDLSKPAITTCGSGITAAILGLALTRLGATFSLYDGSWAEWGMYGDLRVATGEA